MSLWPKLVPSVWRLLVLDRFSCADGLPVPGWFLGIQGLELAGLNL